jgi:hypothetical protein
MGELEVERIGFQSVTESFDSTTLGGEPVLQSPVPVKWKSPSDGSVDANDALSRKSSTGGGNRTRTGVPFQRILSPQRLT